MSEESRQDSATEAPDADAAPLPEGAMQVLRIRMRDFISEWNAALGNEWHCDRAIDLHEKLEQMIATADQLKAISLTDPAIELIVYMCSFLEASAYPNKSQHQHMRELVERLGRSLEYEPNVKKRGNAIERSSKYNIVFYVRRNESEVPDLAVRLGQHRYVVHPFVELIRAVEAAARVIPDVLIVEDSFVPQLHLLMDAIERRGDTQKSAVVCLVLAQGVELGRTLYAQRAGADAVTAQTDPVTIAAQVDELLLQRRSQSYRILIVEDDRAQAQFCESVLRHKGMVSHVCTTGGEVLGAIMEFKPDLVLLDLYLPDINGIEIAQRIRERPELSLLPVVFLSGEHDLDLRFDAIRMGGDDFITKPIKPLHLILTVQSRVRRARLLGSGAAGGERRGALVSRETFVREMLRSAGADEDQYLMLAMVAVDAQEALHERVGFVAMGILAQQVAAALGTELNRAHPPCACAELAFLMVLRGSTEHALQKEVDGLRARLQARVWLSAEHTAQLNFTIAGLRLGPEVAKADAMIHRVMQKCRDIQKQGGDRTDLDFNIPGLQTDDDPQTRIIKSLLRGPMSAEMVRITFQPRVPLAGQVVGQYVARMMLAPPKFSHSLLLEPTVYGAIANELGLMARVDRAFFHHALRRLKMTQSLQRELHLILPVSTQSLVDPAFAPWLVAEMRSLQLPPMALTVEFNAGELREHVGQLDSVLDSVQRAGVHLSLALANNDATDRKLMAHQAFRSVGIKRPVTTKETTASNPWQPVEEVIREALRLGKIAFATEVMDMSELGSLLRLGVHYAQGDVLCPWLGQMDFDFSGVLM